MKKLLILALSFAMSGMLYAHGTGGAYRHHGTDGQFNEEMNEMHELMHNTSIQGKSIDKGVSISITASADSAVEQVKKRFLDEREKLDTYFQNLSVTVSAIDNGVEVILESEDENSVKRLQTYGANSIYSYLHSSVFGERFGKGGFGPMGYGHGHGMGYGPGMMYGSGNNNQGPGYMPCHEAGNQTTPKGSVDGI